MMATKHNTEINNEPLKREYFDDVLDDESLKDITLEIYEYRCNTLGLSDDITSELTGMINEDKKRKEKYLGGFDSDKFYLKYFKTLMVKNGSI